MKRLGRDAAELTALAALADHLTTYGLVLEMLAWPLPSLYDPSGPGRILFGFFAAMAETERGKIREATLEGLDTAARKHKHGGRPAVITDDMLHTVLRRRAVGETVEAIRPDLIIPTSRCKGPKPSLASIYRVLSVPGKTRAHPDAVQQAHAEYGQPGRAGGTPAIVRPRAAEPVDEAPQARAAQLPSDSRPLPSVALLRRRQTTS